jgi:hypothetical protein
LYCVFLKKNPLFSALAAGDKDENTFYEEYVAKIGEQQPL